MQIHVDPALSYLNFVSFYFFSLVMIVLGLCCRVWAFSSSGEHGLLFVAVRGPLTVVASPVVEHGL